MLLAPTTIRFRVHGSKEMLGSLQYKTLNIISPIPNTATPVTPISNVTASNITTPNPNSTFFSTIISSIEIIPKKKVGRVNFLFY